jgi:phospholipid transport system substrate-binding protein
MKIKAVTLVTILALLAVMALTAVPAQAGDAQDTLKKNIDEFISILKDPQYKPDTMKDAQRDKIWVIIHRIFDFEGVSRRAVGRNWSKFAPKETTEFIDAFAELLGTNYLIQIQEQYTNETVEYISEDTPAKGRSVVKTVIKRGTKADIPVDYSMWLRDGVWRIYDVKVEGVSLVQNYRRQFAEILMKDPPSVLIERVKEKAKERKEKQKAGNG